VLDEDDNPIPGVNVIAKILGRKVVPFPEPADYFARTVRRKTNKEGRFKIKGYYGGSLSFYPNRLGNSVLYKDRYEFVQEGMPNYFRPCGGIYKGYLYTTIPGVKNPYIKLSAASPFVYRMRKLEEPTYLLKNNNRNAGISAKGDEQFIYYDIIKNIQYNSAKTLNNNREPLTCDFIILCKWEESNSRWAITFAAGTTNGGVQFQNMAHYTAPIDGYEPEITFYVYYRGNKYGRADTIFLKDFPNEPLKPTNAGNDFPYGDKYKFYTKSRECEIYSRISMPPPSFYDGELRLPLHITTNPYAGQRSLELEPNISYELKKALDKEIKDAFAKDPNAIIPPPPPEMFKMPDSKIPQIMAERQRLISK